MLPSLLALQPVSPGSTQCPTTFFQAAALLWSAGGTARTDLPVAGNRKDPGQLEQKGQLFPQVRHLYHIRRYTFVPQLFVEDTCSVCLLFILIQSTFLPEFGLKCSTFHQDTWRGSQMWRPQTLAITT